MQLLAAIDDTDSLDSDHGTGRLSRELAVQLADTYDLSWTGCVRQQFLVDPRIPYTTHNSAACMLFECADPSLDMNAIMAEAGTFLQEKMAAEADPGLCVADAMDVPPSVIAFGQRAGEEIIEKSEAYDVTAASDVLLDEYGGTGDGVIGALGAVGLTAAGEAGRFIAYTDIREYGESVAVERLCNDGIHVVNAAGVAIDTGRVNTHDWIRPLLRDGRPVLPTEPDDDGNLRPSNLD